MFKHQVRLLIQRLQLVLISAQLLLLLSYHGLRIILLQVGGIPKILVFSLQRLVYVSDWVITQVLGEDFRIGEFFIVFVDDVEALAIARPSEFADVA